MSTYWVLVGAIFLGWFAIMAIWRRYQLGVILGQPVCNNNWRWLILFLCANLCAGSAFVGGFGEPILSGYWKEFWPSAMATANKMKPGETLKSNLTSFVLGGDLVETGSHTPAVTPSKPPAPAKKYPSWFWWKLSLVLWLATIIYFPIAFREEFREVLERKRADSISGESESGRTAPPSIIPSPPGGTVKTWGFFDDLKAGLSAEVIKEVFTRIFKKWFH
ncbi:MAG: hypothetical protein WC610_00035 [Patescibacteria group bacterium]